MFESDRSTRKSSGGLIIGAVCIVIGYFGAFHWGKSILDDARASAEWPSVGGKVVSSRVVQSRGSGEKTRFRADVVYKYVVEGREFQADTISFGMEFTSSKAVHRIRNRYPKGKEVKVFYNPKSPETAVLEAGATWKSYAVFGVGLVFFGVGLVTFGSSLLRWLGLGLALAGVFGALFLRRPKASADPSSGPSDPSPSASSGTGPAPEPPHEAPGGGQPAADDGIDIG